jgi:hypothetical protein
MQRSAVSPIVLGWSTLLVWLLPALTASIVLARIAVWLENAGYASALLPVVMGAALGLVVSLLALRTNISSRTAALIATVILALVCVATEHLLIFIDYRLKILEAAQGDPKLQMIQAAGNLPVPTFWEYIRAQASVRIAPGSMPNWLWWIINTSLTIVASIGAVWLVMPNWRSRASSGHKLVP